MSYYEEFVEDNVDEVLNEDQEAEDNNYELFNSYDYISKPIKSERCTIDEKIIQLHHSFGYDCYTKMFNICAADDHTVVYAAGSYINIFDINNGSLNFRKCAGNGGIGHITKNPVYSHLAIGENCSNPLIIVYEWPSFEIISVLKGSAKKQNNWLIYSQNGNYLCSQGGEPDNTLTIWDWKNSKIVLRTKSHTQDVYICRFSTFIPGHLITAGSGHIKFWKMANTFTGLKLQGRLGRFGKTEISNVIGIFSMPNEKVISGCEWGNILVWDEELIDIQVMRKGRKPCHLGPIIMFLYSEKSTELTSISMDGTIKFWYYHTVDIADPPEKDRVLEMEPSFIINIKDSIGVAKIMGMCKINNDPNSYDYFIQDGNGGLWLADIEVSANAKPLKRLAKFHGNIITSLQSSPIGYFIATTSLDGWFHVYDVVNRKLIFMHNFTVPITSLIWLPLKICSGNIFIVGFQTGILKVVTVPLKEIVKNETFNLTEIQSSKPNTSSISHLTINENAKILVCGSDDCSIFIYKIETKTVKLYPIGMFPLPGKVTFIHWKPSKKQTALISCASGHIIEINIPTNRPSYTKESFLLKLESRVIKTVSVKSEIHRNTFILNVEHKKKEKIVRKMEKLRIIKEENPSAEIDEELYFEDSDEDEEPPKIFIPQIPNAVLFAIYTSSEKSLLVSIDGYDAGYLYEYDLNTSGAGPINSIMIPDKDNIPLTAINKADTSTMLMGFSDGRIRVTNVKMNTLSDLNDYIEYSVHDNKTGKVKMLCFSHDKRMLYTFGDDGNIFSFVFKCEESIIEKCMVSASDLPPSPKIIEEDIIKIKEDLKLSLEERKINKEKHKALNLANKEKDRINCLLYGLKQRFKQVLIINKSLPKSIQFSHKYFQFDERINRSLINEAKYEMDQLQLKFEFEYEKTLLGLKKIKNYFVNPILTKKFEVKAILKDIGVKSIYHEVHHNLFHNLVEEFVSKKHPKQKLKEIKHSNSNRQRKSTVLEKPTDNQNHKITEAEIFLRNIRETYSSLPKKIQSAIDKFSARVDFETKKILQIRSMCNNKPDNINIEEESILNNAWGTIGDFNLKTAPEFKPSDEQIITMEDKFDQYVEIKEELYNLKSNFNKQVFDLKQCKIQLIQDYKQFKFEVNFIQNELNNPDIRTPSDFPEVLIDESIDLNLIDSSEPICHLDSMYLVLNKEKSDFNEEMFKNKYYENPTYLETIMQQMRKDYLKYRHSCLHESMLTKIHMFDDHLLMLDKTRKNVKFFITFLELFALTLEEELIILNDFDLLEDDYLYNIYLKTGKQNDKVNQIMEIRDDIKYFNTLIDNKSNRLIDIQQTFDMEVRNNDFAKYLRKIFKKKFKIPKIKSDDDDDSLSSSSSSEESDESDTESIKNVSGESFTAMGQVTMFDENILPEGCDPKLFSLTFELRTQRHEIEQSIESIKKKVELSNKNLNVAYTELTTIEYELEKNLNELEAYRIKKQLKLNDVEITILLNKSQMTKAKLLKTSVLVYGNVMQILTNRVIELKKEKEDINKTYKSEKILAKQLRKEKNMMENTLNKYKMDIKDKIMNKFRLETDWKFLNNMEMDIINYMIIQAKSNAGEMRENLIKEVKLIENQIGVHQEKLTDLLGAQTVKIITLKAIREGIQQIQQSLSIQQKNNIKVQNLSIDSTSTSDLDTLKVVYNTLSKRKQNICKEINILKHKGKMFPSIVKQQCTKMEGYYPTGDQFSSTPTVIHEKEEEDSGESWTTDNKEESYNMEFNIEPKTLALSKQLPQLKKQQLSHDGSFKTIEDEYGEEWDKYLDEELTIPPGDVENIYGKIDNNSSDEDIGSDEIME